jgi:hypothetical protein
MYVNYVDVHMYMHTCMSDLVTHFRESLAETSSWYRHLSTLTGLYAGLV